MTPRIDPSKRPDLIRDPADWARDSGWVSRVRAERAAARLLNVADGIDSAFNAAEDEAAAYWCAELRSVAKYLAPKKAAP